jgi:phospholipid transport system substrate-binding protein
MNKFKTIITLFLCFSLGDSFASSKHNQDINQYVQTLIDNAFSILNNNSLSQQQKIFNSEKLMEKNLDVAWMADFSLGRQRKSLSPEQLQKYRNIYNKHIVQSYSSKIKSYKGEKIAVKDVKQINQDGFAVKTEILSPSKNNIHVNFMVRKKGEGQFLVFDVVTEGVSLITAQRSEFSSVIASQGIDELIKTLESKTQKK